MLSLLSRSWILSFAIISFAATIAGMYALGIPWIITTILLVSVFGLCTTYLVVTEFSLIKSYWSGYNPYKSRSITTFRHAMISVNDHFIPNIRISRQIIFLQTPKAGDLIDLIDTKVGYEFSSHHYESTDSSIASLRLAAPHIMAVEWKPNDEIEPYIPYIHETINTSPCIYGPDSFFHSFYVDREIGEARFSLNLPLRMYEAFSFVMPRFRRDISDWVIFHYGLRANKRQCVQPDMSSDKLSLEWVLKRPKLGRTYVIVGMYEGFQHVLEQDAKKCVPSIAQRLIMRAFP
jgi:hypothetical protein